MMADNLHGFGGEDMSGAYAEAISRGNVVGVNKGYDSTGMETNAPGLSPTQDGGSDNREASIQGNASFGTTNATQAQTMGNDLGDLLPQAIARGNISGVNEGYNSVGDQTSTPGLSPTQDGGHEDRKSTG